MLFRTLTKQNFRRLVEIIFEANEVIGPKKVGVDTGGKPMHQFLPVGSFDEIDLGYEMTQYSAKTYFLPFRENLSTYRFEEGGLDAGCSVSGAAAGVDRAARLRH